ncbi:UNVERIFIED_CONTAM: hypothetical protein HDU68_002912 [Siphonaria sp. JEL0065]|nr:hypothetical protein HDU68_002912 [Siphonaria sp. JEL0065]
MASPILVANTYYQDNQCAKPIRISYFHVNNTDCTAASIAGSSTCAVSASNGWWYMSQCVASANVASVGNKIFGSDVPQVLSSYADKGCPTASQPLVSGALWPFDKCIPAFPEAGYKSFRTFLDPSNGTIYWSSFSETNCRTLTDFSQYGSTAKPNQCVSDFDASVTLLNYQTMIVYTTYSGSDCRYASKVSSLPALGKCEADAKCQYFAYHSYLDSNCALPWEIEYALLGLCTTTSHYSGESVNSSLSADGSIITVTIYSNPGCLGSVVTKNGFSTDGSCTSQGRVTFQKAGSNSTGGNNGGGGGSNASIGAIVGGAIGGIVVLGAILVVAVFYAKQRKSAAPTETPRLDVNPPAVPFSKPDVNPPVPPFVKPNVPEIPLKEVVLSDPKAIPAPPTVSIDEPVFLVSTSSAPAMPEKLKLGLFDALPNNTAVASLAKAAEAQSSSSAPSTEKEYAMFGDLCLPSLPSQWSIDEVVEWVSKNEGTAEVLRFIKEQEIDGRALLFMNLDALQFQTVGRRIRFEESLIALRNINNAKLASLEENVAPPSYS